MPLSSKQMEYLALAWQCFEAEPKIDYEKFKSVAGLSSAASARELMRVTKKKLKEEYGALSGTIKESNAGTAGGKPTPSTPKTPASRKRAAPSSSTGKKSAKKSATSIGNGAGGSDDEDTPVAKKQKVNGRVDSASPVKENGPKVKKEKGHGLGNGEDDAEGEDDGEFAF